MKGIALAFIVTVVFFFIVVGLILGGILTSMFLKFSQTQRISTILSATEQPLSIASGLLQTKLLDGRTLLEESLHALGNSSLLAPPAAGRAFQVWQIDRWTISVASQQREIELGGALGCFASSIRGQCAESSVCPAGSETVPGGQTQCGGRSCCREDYDFTNKAYKSTLLLRGMPTCGPEVDSYYGVCEPGSCSLGRKDMGLSNCPELPIGTHCCRPLEAGEASQITEVDTVSIPLIYLGMNGTLTIGVSTPPLILR